MSSHFSFVSLLMVCIHPWLYSSQIVAQQSVSTASSTVSFQQQVRPILADNCLACHGFDAKTREAALRLDRRDEALNGGESGKPAIVPGNADASELIRRVAANADSDALMPPAQHGKPLSPEKIELLRAWINQGAQFEEHWAFVTPQKAPAAASNPAIHPIDAIVRTQLQKQQLRASPAEAPNLLCRRLYLDLIGLPPSTDELGSFQRDGYEATVNKLLASERFGEKWARQWLDGARYSDTNGYEKDLKRDQWAWRDWVIRALNADMPYDQFIIEQIAGDLLPSATQDQLIATGFLRNSMINEEGAIVPEQFRMVEMFDRMDCIGKSILGLTTGCSQCHSHKFDPLTQAEYYGMFAFLNNTYEAQSWIYTSEQLAKQAELLARIKQAEELARGQRPGWQQELDGFAAQLKQQNSGWKPIAFDDMNSISGLNHPTQERDLTVLMKGHSSGDVYLIGSPELRDASGLRFELLNHGDLPFLGPGRSGLGTWGVREIEVFIQLPEAKEWQKIKLINATADFSEPEQKHDEGKSSSGPVSLLIDGNDASWWKADRGIGLRNSPSLAVVQFESPLNAPAGTRFKIAMRMTDMVGCCRFSLTQAPTPAAASVDYAAVMAASEDAQSNNQQSRHAIFSAWRKTLADLKPINDQIEALTKQLPVAATSVLHAAERPAHDVRATHYLNRGEWDKPLQAIAPHVPAAFHQLEKSDEPPRLQFARWLVDKRSPLAARVAVNRIWQSIFGQGLVETSEDFGTRAALPVQLELLDWLAVDFMEHGWSSKSLIHRVVSSQTYQQSSRATQEEIELDPENRLLARGPRFRADAEVIRDMAMTIGGLMHHQFGGPAVIPPVPQNVLDYNYVYPSYWTPAQGPQRYRRTVYSFRKRSMPDPAMSALDAPNADFACARRVRSNTPLAALTGLNEPIFVESARGLALRVLKESIQDERSRIDYAYQLCTARLPTDVERKTVIELLESQRKRIADGWLNPREVISGKADQLPPLPEGATPQDAAAWTIAARVLLNLDETITKN